MWTKQHRKTYKRSDERYPSDLTDAEWSHLEPLIPPAKSGGRPRGTDMREAINAILYILRTGCPWRYLPRGGFPPRSTVYNIFRNFKRDGVWDAIWDSLHMDLRETLGREASSETSRPFQTTESSSSLLSTRSRLRTRHSMTSKALGSTGTRDEALRSSRRAVSRRKSSNS